MTSFGVSNARKFKVLSWKTLIVKARHYVETVLDILVPSLLFIVLVVLRFKFEGLSPEPKPAVSFEVKNVFEQLGIWNYQYQLCSNGYDNRSQLLIYSPLTKAANETMAQWKTNLESCYLQFCRREDLSDFRWGKYLYFFNDHIHSVVHLLLSERRSEIQKEYSSLARNKVC